jgi:RNA polymerase sigma-70 factor (ECF subfamily)
VDETRQVQRGEVAGDESSFVTLIEPVLPDAIRLAVAMLHSQEGAEDCVQEAVFRAWRGFARFRQGASVKPWLLAIVANECRRFARKRLRPITTSLEPFNSKAAANDPANIFSLGEIRRAIRRLPHNQRVVIALRYYLDLSFAEMGQILGISPNTAKLRTHRALKRLRLSAEVMTDE